MISDFMRANTRSLEYVTNPGSREKITKHGVVGADGVIRLVNDGIIDIQDQIQSYEPSTNIYNILSNLSPEEFRSMTPASGDFIDATDMPKTYAEALQLVIDGQNQFMSLPLEVRQKFDNDFNKWFVTAGSPEWFEKLGIDISGQNVVQPIDTPAEPSPIEKEVKE